MTTKTFPPTEGTNPAPRRLPRHLVGEPGPDPRRVGDRRGVHHQHPRGPRDDHPPDLRPGRRRRAVRPAAGDVVPEGPRAAQGLPRRHERGGAAHTRLAEAAHNTQQHTAARRRRPQGSRSLSARAVHTELRGAGHRDDEAAASARRRRADRSGFRDESRARQDVYGPGEAMVFWGMLFF